MSLASDIMKPPAPALPCRAEIVTLLLVAIRCTTSLIAFMLFHDSLTGSDELFNRVQVYSVTEEVVPTLKNDNFAKTTFFNSS